MTAVDPESLDRFVEAQASIYAKALAEIRRGAKRSHWMWFIFPQLAGLGRSATAKFFGIRSLDEARNYLAHPVLGKRYFECVAAVQDLVTSDPAAVFGDTDAMKLRSSLTLFEMVDASSQLAAALDGWFAGQRDIATLEMLQDD